MRSATPKRRDLKRTKSKLHDDIKALEDKLEALEDDPIMRMAQAIYQDRVRKAKLNMRDRYIAAAKEKDPFLKAVKKPIVSDEELR